MAKKLFLSVPFGAVVLSSVLFSYSFAIYLRAARDVPSKGEGASLLGQPSLPAREEFGLPSPSHPSFLQARFHFPRKSKKGKRSVTKPPPPTPDPAAFPPDVGPLPCADEEEKRRSNNRLPATPSEAVPPGPPVPGGDPEGFGTVGKRRSVRRPSFRGPLFKPDSGRDDRGEQSPAQEPTNSPEGIPFGGGAGAAGAETAEGGASGVGTTPQGSPEFPFEDTRRRLGALLGGPGQQQSFPPAGVTQPPAQQAGTSGPTVGTRRPTGQPGGPGMPQRPRTGAGDPQRYSMPVAPTGGSWGAAAGSDSTRPRSVMDPGSPETAPFGDRQRRLQELLGGRGGQ
ncbi:hypothetical protein, conserved [Eimeria acervulina]|uniref:Uncharacterized protein n=1 Tax=Eimeria acervulina TaxID=5801 RepID=U6GNQ6_EIMAC|nr:hypothetical protein, conserved [Eimeria acervulina]CDI81202.1 hypothetical protein, conserved [Eimeria acervulina]